MDFFAAQDHARKQTKKLVVYFILAVTGIIVSIYAVCAFLFSLDIPLGELVGEGGGGSSYYQGASGSRSGYDASGSVSGGRSGYDGSSYSTAPRRDGLPSSRSGASGSGSVGHSAGGTDSAPASVRWWNPQLLATVSGVVLLVILGASALKTMQLRSGGGVVARSLGGRQVDPGTKDAAERRLLNVVEEMALASGTPIPEVYVLDNEQGINAFAAGHSPHDAAIGVTRGCIDTLNRDELQGVIAHEFSHILNGDMRLNVRLIGILFGILVLAILGEGLMRSALWSGGARRNSKDNSAMVFLVLGLAVMAIGYIGVLFGRLIQSAISRQREFLADASAVQFTRYPDGIANALIKIGAGGSRLQSEHAQETAHMFFASGIKQHFGGGFATHPPLHSRIRAIRQDWDGTFEVPRASRAERRSPAPPHSPEGLGGQNDGGQGNGSHSQGGSAAGGSAQQNHSSPAGSVGGASGSSGTGNSSDAASGSGSNGAGNSSAESAPVGGSGTAAIPGALAAGGVFGAMGAMRAGRRGMRADAALAAIGTLATEQIAHAQVLHAQARAVLGEAGSDPLAAKALIYALMLGEDDAAKLPEHLAWLQGEVEPEIFAQIEPFVRQLAGQEALLLPLLELAMPALAKLEKAQLKAFGERLERLAARDERLSFGELAVVALVRRKISRKVAASAQEQPVVADAARLSDAFSTVLTAVLRADAQVAGSPAADSSASASAASAQTAPSAKDEQAAFAAALAKAPLFAGLAALKNNVSNETFLPALETLSVAAFALKKQILAAAAEAVMHDGHVSIREAEWLRLLAACLDCPMPPLVQA